MSSRICIRCTETQSDDSPMYDAKDYTNELTEEEVRHTPEDQVCITCASNYERTKWLKNATEPMAEDHESIESQLQALKEEEHRLAE